MVGEMVPKHFRCFGSNHFFFFYTWLLSASCLQASLSIKEMIWVRSHNFWLPFYIVAYMEEEGHFFRYNPVTAFFTVITFWHVYSMWCVDQETIACPQLTYWNKLHAILICIVKHFGNCDGERHGVTIFSLPSLELVKMSPDSYQYIVDRIAWPENWKYLSVWI